MIRTAYWKAALPFLPLPCATFPGLQLQQQQQPAERHLQCDRHSKSGRIESLGQEDRCYPEEHSSEGCSGPLSLSPLHSFSLDLLRCLCLSLLQSFRAKFPGATEEALDLLSQMLRFDPEQRITAEESMAHPFFASLHEKNYARNYLTSTSPTLKDSRAPSFPPVPMNADIEKMGESKENLWNNVCFTTFLLFYNSYQKISLSFSDHERVSVVPRRKVIELMDFC